MTNEFDASFEFIDELLLKHRVSLRSLSNVAETQMDDLQQAERIFDLKEEKDGKLCLALFRLMAGNHATAISESFCSMYNLDPSLDDFSFERNKLFLLAAFVHNPSFFAMSWNLCGIIQSELASQGEKSNRTFLPRRNIAVLAASSADVAMKEIWSEDIEENGISGKLRILANNKDGAGKLQFRFKFSEYHSEPPYYLVARYTTKSDGIEYQAELSTTPVNNSKNKELVIASAIQTGVNYSGGLDLDLRKHG